MLPADPGPGPGSYTAPSSLGPQLLSTRGNFETAKFKTGNRWSNFKSDFWADFYCPRRDACTRMHPRCTNPLLASSLASTVSSALPKLSHGFVFRSHVVGDGKMPAGNLGDAPSYSFSGKGGRYDPMKQGTPGNVPSYLRNPGPGDYTQGSSFGRQLVSRKATAPTGKIGTDTRDKRSKLYYSPQHEKEWQGQHSPGPNYDPVSSIGQQVGAAGRGRRACTCCRSLPSLGQAWKRDESLARSGCRRRRTRAASSSGRATASRRSSPSRSSAERPGRAWVAHRSSRCRGRASTQCRGRSCRCRALRSLNERF